jgi:hypothetical protein
MVWRILSFCSATKQQKYLQPIHKNGGKNLFFLLCEAWKLWKIFPQLLFGEFCCAVDVLTSNMVSFYRLFHQLIQPLWFAFVQCAGCPGPNSKPQCLDIQK